MAVGRRERASVISIDAILEEERIEEWDTDRVALRSFLRANEFARARTQRNLRRHRSTIIEGNFYWNEQLQDLIDHLPLAPMVVRLTAPVEVCIRRDARRPEPAPRRGPRAGDHMREEAARAVFAFIRPFPGETVVDARGTVDEIVARIQRAVRTRSALTSRASPLSAPRARPTRRRSPSTAPRPAEAEEGAGRDGPPL